MEENVYEETTRAEQPTAERGEDVGRKDAEEKGLALLGKFKDVDALARAYEALQAEFTRRSQRLKELERATEHCEKEDGGRLGVDKLRKNARSKREATKQFDEFLASQEEGRGKTSAVQKEISESDTETVSPLKTEGSETGNLEKESTVCELNTSFADLNGSAEASGEQVLEAGKTAEGQAFAGAEKRGGALPFVAENDYAAVSSDALYEQVSRDEGVRLRIIGEYLSSLGKSVPPLMAGSAGITAAPPRKAGSISAAGDMALLYFKKPKVN